jgi:hypothetical protein
MILLLSLLSPPLKVSIINQPKGEEGEVVV